MACPLSLHAPVHPPRIPRHAPTPAHSPCLPPSPSGAHRGGSAHPLCHTLPAAHRTGGTVPRSQGGQPCPGFWWAGQAVQGSGGRDLPSGGLRGCAGTPRTAAQVLLPHSMHIIAAAPPCLPPSTMPQAWHFDVDASRNRLDFSWRLKAGASEAGHYGLALARSVGFPDDVMEAADEVVAGGALRTGREGVQLGGGAAKRRGGATCRKATHRFALAPAACSAGRQRGAPCGGVCHPRCSRAGGCV